MASTLVRDCLATADVLTIENSRSGDEMIAALAKYGYSRDLGASRSTSLAARARIGSRVFCLLANSLRGLL